MKRALYHLSQRIIYLPFISAMLMFSCQKNLTQSENTNPIVLARDSSQASVESLITIDTMATKLASPFLEEIYPNLTESVNRKVKTFYIANGMQTKWFMANRPSELYYELIETLKNAHLFGLSPEDYFTEAFEKDVEQVYSTKSISDAAVADLDVRASETFFIFTGHLSTGKIQQLDTQNKTWIRHEKQATNADVSMLIQTEDAAEFRDALAQLQPPHEQYRRLQKALQHYQSLISEETFININEKIKPRQQHPAIPAIRQRLSLIEAKSVNTPEGSDSLTYDSTLEVAVKRFQASHGLQDDGIIGDKTVKYLNQPFEDKANLIALNMERLRWAPEDYGNYCIRVNIPEFKLRIYESTNQTLEMKVIVGSVHTATPVFNDSLERIVFSPTWTVPPSIMKAEIFSRLKKDSSYYTGKDYIFYKNGKVIDPSTQSWENAIKNAHQYRVVQRPGTENALGLVKFVMPNDMNIYLHDTPDHSLFSKNYRALSHGCIRLDDPAKFAAYFLEGDEKWNIQNIDRAMKDSSPTVVELNMIYPVYLEYNTVWVDDNGTVNFREDIYGHDRIQMSQLLGEEKAVDSIARVNTATRKF